MLSAASIVPNFLLGEKVPITCVEVSKDAQGLELVLRRHENAVINETKLKRGKDEKYEHFI